MYAGTPQYGFMPSVLVESIIILGGDSYKAHLMCHYLYEQFKIILVKNNPAEWAYKLNLL